MSLKPAVKVQVGEAHGAQGLKGCLVWSTHTMRKKPIYAGDDWHFTFPDSQTKLWIGDVSDRLSVTITNQTTVPLTLTTHVRGDELTDILGANKRFHVAGGSKVVVEA